MAGDRAHRGAPIQERQLPGRINREGADRAGRFALELVDFIDRKQEPALQVQFEERRIRRLGRQSEWNQRDILGNLGAGWLQPEIVNALALCLGVRADIDQGGIPRGIACLWHGITPLMASRETDADTTE